MTNMERLIGVERELKALGVTVEVKGNQWYWKTLNVLLLIVSFGQMKTFMTDYHTTLGARIGVTPTFASRPAAEQYATLLHELQHIKQYRRYGFGNIWVGAILCMIPYLFLPLPIGLAYCRAQMEKEAYRESIRAWVQCYGLEQAGHAKDHIVKQFTSVNYLFMWPFKAHMDKWYDDALAQIVAEESVR